VQKLKGNETIFNRTDPPRYLLALAFSF